MNAVLKTAIAYWPRVAPVLKPARTRADYERLVLALDHVLDAGGSDEKHPLASLAGYLGDLVSDYERAHAPLKEMSAPDLLRELMQQHGLTSKRLRGRRLRQRGLPRG